MRFVLWLCGTLFITANVYAQTTSYISDAEVLNVRVYSDGRFGGCGAQISKNINTAGSNQLSCGKTTFISFDCEGAYVSKASGQSLFQMMQLAMVSNRLVDVVVDQTRVWNETTCTGTYAIVKLPVPQAQ